MEIWAMEPIVIKTSTKKLVQVVIFSIVFIIVGFFMFGKESNRYSKEFLYVVSLLGIAMGLIGVVYSISILFKKDKTALVIDNKGITDRSSMVSLGFIPWQDVTSVRLTSMQTNRFSKTYFITILVKNPDQYIAKGKNLLARYSLQWNTDKSGSPINIAPSTFGMKPEELKKIIKDAFERYKTTAL